MFDFIKYFINIGEYNFSILNIFSVFILYISILYSIFLFFYIKKQKNNIYVLCMKSYIIGTYCSIIYGIVFRTLNYGIKYAILSPSAAYRNFGASVDPNYFGFYIAISIAFILILYLKKEEKLLKCLINIFVYLIVGFSSISRMFLVLCLPIALYFFIIWIKMFFSKKMIYAVTIVFIVCGLIFTFKSYIFNNIDLIINRLKVNSSVDITNGRADLAKDYISLINSSPRYSFFGVGISKYYKRLGIPLYAHNFYVELYVCFGLVGVILFCILFFKYLLKNKIYLNIFYFLPLLIMLISGMAISFIEVECIYILASVIMAIMSVLSEEKLKDEKSVTYLK